MRHAVCALLLTAALFTGCDESTQAPPTTTPDAGLSQQDPTDTAPPAQAPAEPTSEETEPPAVAVEPEAPVTDPLADAPERFTDHAPQFVSGQDAQGETIVIETDPVPFDMIRIPGDEAQGIAPFYMGETEVTWAMIESWGYCRDIADWEEAMRLIGEGLRPSWLDGIAQVIYEMDKPGRPVVGATRHTAEMFCRWLSEKTGRTYRLPTPEEFALALRLGGGVPSDPEQLLAMGRFKENAQYEDEFFGPLEPGDPFAEEFIRVTEVKSHEPDRRGLYDLLGNAGEWVAVPGGEAYLMGGHFAVPAGEMSADWNDAEDHDIWNEIYPQHPYSEFWYWGQHHFQGFRLVCETD
ncbi:MAG: formylglycine-generating enzyme family protein [Phycisphaerales bacterium JB063]